VSLPLTDADFALFEEPAAAAAAPQQRPARGRPSARPARQPAVHKPAVQKPAVQAVKPLKGESRQSKDDRAHKVWIQSLTAYAVCGIVAFCLFMVIQSGAGYHQALMEQRQLMVSLQQAQQRSIGYQTQIERKFSLEVIQNYAKDELHMIPIEGGRVTHINVSRGDERLE